jgi:Amino acid permease
VTLFRFNLFVAFSFTVMADPVSSVAYAIEAALDALDGDLGDLVPTMGLVIATIAIVSATYHQLIRRFPSGGGGPRSLATAFGEGWAFLPLGALLVDFTLTVAVSCAAGAAALIAYVPELADWRTPVALGLAVAVAAGISLGHRGRVFFATATLAFLGLALVVIARGAFADPGTGVEATPTPLADAKLLPVLLAMPLGMALATGVEAPSDAIAQLPQLGDRGRRLFGQLTIWLMVGIVGGLTIALALLAVHLGIGLPPEDSTLLAEVGRRATGGDATFALFQIATALLLLAAAGSSYLAASGVLKALALHGADGTGLLPRRFAIINRFLVPYWGVALVLAAAAVLISLAGGDEQQIVRFYAVAVFASFLGALIGCARLSLRDGMRAAFAVNAVGIVLVAFVLAINLTRIDAVISLVATAAIALYLWRAWIARGRPRGLATAMR